MDRNQFNILKGEKKLKAGMDAIKNRETWIFDKGNAKLKTKYEEAIKFGSEALEEYINNFRQLKQNGKKTKAPNVSDFKKFIQTKHKIKGYKIQLFPTKEQTNKLFLYVEAYNWTYIHLYYERMNNVIKPFIQAKRKVFQHKANCWFKKVNSVLPWPEFPKWAPAYPLKKNWPDSIKEASSVVINACVNSFPTKPSRKRIRHIKNGTDKSFAIYQSSSIKTGDDFIELPGVGQIKHSRPRYIPLKKKVSNIGIEYINGKWFAGLSIDLGLKPKLKNNGLRLGIDPGVRTRLTLFNGNNHAQYTFSRGKNHILELEALENNLKYYQRKAARRYKKDSKTQSSRYYFAISKIQKIQKQIANKRNNDTHQISHRVLKSNVNEIILENPNIKGMIEDKSKSSRLHDKISKASMGKLLEQLKYKASWRGIKTIEADQYFPSSKLCSNCWFKNNKLSSDEYWICPNCNIKHHRDENASKNFYNYPQIISFMEKHLIKQYKDLAIVKTMVDNSEGPSNNKEQSEVIQIGNNGQVEPIQ